MKTAEARDAMVARVKAAHAKWPGFNDLPVVTEFGPEYVMQPVDEKREAGLPYIDALYEMARVADIVGRREKGALLVGKLPKNAKAKA